MPARRSSAPVAGFELGHDLADLLFFDAWAQFVRGRVGLLDVPVLALLGEERRRLVRIAAAGYSTAVPEESATPDLVEVVTGLFEAADRGDWEAMIAPYAPDAIWESEDGITNAAGASRVRGLLEEWAAVFEGFTIKVETVVDLGNGVVFSVYHQEGRPAGGTGVVNDRGAMIYEWVDGMIARVIVRQDIDEARAYAERLAEERG